MAPYRVGGGLKEASYLQNKITETPLPISLVKEVIEMAAKCDEDKTKCQEAKNT